MWAMGDALLEKITKAGSWSKYDIYFPELAKEKGNVFIPRIDASALLWNCDWYHG